MKLVLVASLALAVSEQVIEKVKMVLAQVSAADFHAQTGANFFRLFKRVPQSEPVAA